MSTLSDNAEKKSTGGPAARFETRFADEAVCVISRAHLIQNKRAAGRPQDLADIERLEGNS